MYDYIFHNKNGHALNAILQYYDYHDMENILDTSFLCFSQEVHLSPIVLRK